MSSLEQKDYPTERQLQRLMRQYHERGVELSQDQTIKAIVQYANAHRITPRKAAEELLD
tara:strand:- start:284 stop:460 length:177 start_codon:yes stop_codon:yes gene_type:complete